jgi:hypothetical protein
MRNSEWRGVKTDEPRESAGALERLLDRIIVGNATFAHGLQPVASRENDTRPHRQRIRCRYSLLLLILIDSDVSIGVIEYEATIPYARFFEEDGRF